MRERLEKLERFKYPVLILALGVILMLAPGKGSTSAAAPGESGEVLAQILSCSEGVGNVRVIVSDNGVVVVCQGAENAKTRLEILRAVNSYTGFGSDRITVLRMVD